LYRRNDGFLFFLAAAAEKQAEQNDDANVSFDNNLPVQINVSYTYIEGFSGSLVTGWITFCP
jgi:hypothetical protein